MVGVYCWGRDHEKVPAHKFLKIGYFGPYENSSFSPMKELLGYWISFVSATRRSFRLFFPDNIEEGWSHESL